MSSLSKQFLEIQLKVFKERLFDLKTKHGIFSNEAIRFSKRLHELEEKYNRLIKSKID
ncbi:hypothetical protein [Neobacillus terrae]|uniref:hypothetical protein n=1 Tax=Neobacillus terrae TaxID=3034837 RepID=UPI00140E86C2|nr:hypothetical protein [Neobacillus terrae]NHM33578.1 hypothetical protein [Neobacillus terrae]